ncbi:hypothetical protein FQZ97_1137230 [compost metagenome]
MWDREDDPALDAAALEDFVDLSVARAFGHHQQVVGRRELRQCDPLLVEHVPLAQQAHIALREQATLEEAALELRQQADGQIHLPRLHFITQVYRRVAHGADRHAWSGFTQLMHERRQEMNLSDVGHADHE